MAQCVFKRSEKKYKLNQQQYEAFMKILNRYMTLDQYGLHTICNLYLDTDDFRLIRRSLEKPIYKEKIRLRSYGVPNENSPVFLELKKKYKGVVYKRRVQMTLNEANTYLSTGTVPFADKQVMKEIDYFMQYYEKPVPKVFIAYDRMAYYTDEDENFRITFDTNIRYRYDDVRLESGDRGEKILPDDIYLMEVKAAGSLPRWIIDAFNELKIYPTSFSKYGTIYQETCEKQRSHRIAYAAQKYNRWSALARELTSQSYSMAKVSS